MSNYPGAGPVPPMPPRMGPRNGLGVAALVLGIISIPGTLTVFVGIILGILAIIFGIIGMNRAKKGEATNRGQALAGLITGIIGLVVSIALVAVGLSFFHAYYKHCVTNNSNGSAACFNGNTGNTGFNGPAGN